MGTFAAGPQKTSNATEAVRSQLGTTEALGGNEPTIVRFGECLKTAQEYLMSHSQVKGIRLVYGLYQAGPVMLGHAWVEIGPLIFDGTLQRFYERKKYYAARNLVPVRRLSSRETLLRLLRNGPDEQDWAERLRPLMKKYPNTYIDPLNGLAMAVPPCTALTVPPRRGSKNSFF
jgi:hypothetical protein